MLTKLAQVRVAIFLQFFPWRKKMERGEKQKKEERQSNDKIRDFNLDRCGKFRRKCSVALKACGTEQIDAKDQKQRNREANGEMVAWARTVSRKKDDGYGRVVDRARRLARSVDSSEDPIVTGSGYGLFITVEPCEDGRIHFLPGYFGSNKCPVPVQFGIIEHLWECIKLLHQKSEDEKERFFIRGDLKLL